MGGARNEFLLVGVVNLINYLSVQISSWQKCGSRRRRRLG